MVLLVWLMKPGAYLEPTEFVLTFPPNVQPLRMSTIYSKTTLGPGVSVYMCAHTWQRAGMSHVLPYQEQPGAL